jgi:hypothetical protein
MIGTLVVQKAMKHALAATSLCHWVLCSAYSSLDATHCRLLWYQEIPAASSACLVSIRGQNIAGHVSVHARLSCRSSVGDKYFVHFDVRFHCVFHLQGCWRCHGFTREETEKAIFVCPLKDLPLVSYNVYERNTRIHKRLRKGYPRGITALGRRSTAAPCTVP